MVSISVFSWKLFCTVYKSFGDTDFSVIWNSGIVHILKVENVLIGASGLSVIIEVGRCSLEGFDKGSSTTLSKLEYHIVLHNVILNNVIFYIQFTSFQLKNKCNSCMKIE